MKKLLSLLLIICSIGVVCADDKEVTTSLRYVTNELDARQDKFPANDGKAMTFTNVAGGNLPRDVKSSLGTNTADNGLPTVGAVNTGLAGKQNEIGAVNTNTVATYTNTPGTLGQKGIYQDTGTYVAQQDSLIDAGTFNAALKNGIDNEFVCAGYVDNDPTKPCWLWTIHNDGDTTLNLYDPATNPIEQGGIASATGQGFGANTRVRTSGYINVEPNTQYTISESGLNYFIISGYDVNEDYTFHSTSLTSPYTFTTGANVSKIRIAFANSFQNSVTDPVVTPGDLQWLQIERGATATSHSYNTLVPNGYTPLDYIESTGTQYIDTGLLVKSDSYAEFEYQFVGSDKNYVFGQIAGSASKILGYRTNTIWWFTNNSVNLLDTLKHKVVFDMDGNVYRDNEVIATRGYFSGSPQNLTMLMFAERNDNNTINKGKVKIYNFIFKEGNVMVRNFVPARRDSDSAIGMYDKVSGTFFANSGTGTFTAGPDVSNIIYVPQNQ